MTDTIDKIPVTGADIEIADKALGLTIFNEECEHSGVTIAAALSRLAQITALEQPTPELVEDVARAFAVHAVSRCFGPDDVFIGVHGGHRYAARTALTAIAAHLRKA